jgi:hypothetical protein
MSFLNFLDNRNICSKTLNKRITFESYINQDDYNLNYN